MLYHPWCAFAFLQSGFYGDPKFFCKPIGCQTDSECDTTHECINGDCMPVCGPNNLPCGGNALCQGIAHQYVCTCPPGLDGDPYEACIAVECSDNSACPPEKACINKQCQNPCAISDPCENNSQCIVENHQANCTCPPGYEGSRGNVCQIGPLVFFFATSTRTKSSCLINFCFAVPQWSLDALEMKIVPNKVHVLQKLAKIHVYSLNLVEQTLCAVYWIHCLSER